MLRNFNTVFDAQARNMIAKIAKEVRVLFEDGSDSGIGKVRIKRDKKGKVTAIKVGKYSLNGSKVKSYMIISCLRRERDVK
jgi:hypothetical protein